MQNRRLSKQTICYRFNNRWDHFQWNESFDISIWQYSYPFTLCTRTIECSFISYLTYCVLEIPESIWISYQNCDENFIHSSIWTKTGAQKHNACNTVWGWLLKCVQNLPFSSIDRMPFNYLKTKFKIHCCNIIRNAFRECAFICKRWHRKKNWLPK